ncbi:LacI family DNA-binding transcriptional regulator [Amaricoccus solimangrovi]|uniref:LacI family transcriptional regulator n=1 Tax=Amaricoccus solimangrovi TaxID=2589815 RepID=A0A501WKH3_9RHOB|nr:LacI family DNA-binding transcriptional regulator [Amaricoccus solimangrovi]TPE48945.1 LacI family transcriptional regulator [Amaricoccus solimangrovi]
MEDQDPPAPAAFSPATADDVAALAGVSRWTVARAFKKDASISQKSRRKVMAAAEKLGYVPDLLAASLASDRSNLVALVLDDFENPHKLVMLERLTRVLSREGMGVLLVNMLGADAAGALLSASQRRVDAAVVIGTRFDDRLLAAALEARRVKQLIVFARTSAVPNTLSIACDDAVAMRAIADHLLAAGRRRPMFVAGPDSRSATLERKAAFLGHWRARTGRTPGVIHVAGYDAGSALAGVAGTLAGREGEAAPDALVCENDIIALGAIDALRYRLGLGVPERIAVTGFDDIPLAGAPAYGLTTFRQPITDMAKHLARILGGTGRGSVLLPGRLVVRTSA